MSERHWVTPQGAPLSPLLANVMLDQVDKALEGRGYNFARYADDCNAYVGSKKAGERVLAYLGKRYTGLRLQINAAKRAVAGAFGRKFPGYELRVAQAEGSEAGSVEEGAAQRQDPNSGSDPSLEWPQHAADGGNPLLLPARMESVLCTGANPEGSANPR